MRSNKQKYLPLIALFLTILMFFSVTASSKDRQASLTNSTPASGVSRHTGIVVGDSEAVAAANRAVQFEFKCDYGDPATLQFWLYLGDISSGNTIDSVMMDWTYFKTGMDKPVANTGKTAVGSVTSDSVGPSYWLPVYLDTACVNLGTPKLVKMDSTLTTAILAACDQDGWYHCHLVPNGFTVDRVSTVARAERHDTSGVAAAGVVSIAMQSDTTGVKQPGIMSVALVNDTTASSGSTKADIAQLDSTYGIYSGGGLDSTWGIYSGGGLDSTTGTDTYSYTEAYHIPRIPKDWTIAVRLYKVGANDTLMYSFYPFYNQD